MHYAISEDVILAFDSVPERRLCAMQDLQQMVRLLRPLLDQLARYDDAVLRPSHDTSALQALVRRARDRLFS